MGYTGKIPIAGKYTIYFPGGAFDLRGYYGTRSLDCRRLWFFYQTQGAPPHLSAAILSDYSTAQMQHITHTHSHAKPNAFARANKRFRTCKQTRSHAQANAFACKGKCVRKHVYMCKSHTRNAFTHFCMLGRMPLHTYYRPSDRQPKHTTTTHQIKVQILVGTLLKTESW